MTDEAGAAPAAAESVSAPEPQAQPQAETQTSPQQTAPAPAEAKAEPKIERSKERPIASIDRAFAAVEKQEVQPKQAKSPVTANTSDRDRDEQGRFRAKDAPAIAPVAQPAPEAKASEGKREATASEPPMRFSADAKAAWAGVPDSVKGEVNRAFREMEGGLSQYQQAFEPLKPFFKLAQDTGVEIHRALEQYVGIEQALVSSDPRTKMGAIEDVFRTAGISPRDYAAHVLGQTPDQAVSQRDAEIRRLTTENIQLRRHVEGSNAAQQAQRQNEAMKTVEAFAKDHPRLNDDKFASVVARVIRAGLAEDVESAYAYAERLNPAASPGAQPAAATQAAQPQPNADQTRKGQLSISGAPTSGSNPVNRKPPSSARESVDRAFASFGLG